MLVFFCLLAFVFGDDDDEVIMSGYDLQGTRDFKSNIKVSKVNQLNVKWNVTQCGTAISTPLYKDDIVVSSDYGGCITSYRDSDGSIIVRKRISDYGLFNNTYVRVTPTYSNDMIILVTAGIIGSRTGNGTWVIAVDFDTLELVWKTKISNNIWSKGTSSPLIDDGYIYVGLSSSESAAPLVPGYQCCQSVGTVYEVRLRDGLVTQEVPVFPPELSGVGKFSGGSIWGQMVKLGKYLYFGSGQLYQTTNESSVCSGNNPNNASCVDERVLFDSIIKLRVNKGKPGRGGIVASVRTLAADTWNVACFKFLGIPGCQAGPALDFDVTNLIISKKQKLLFAATKAGMVWTLDLDLNVVGVEMLVNGSIYGGFIYQGALSDNKDKNKLRLYLPDNNGDRYNFTLPNGNVVNTGAWVAYDGYGNLKWATPVPGGGPLGDTAYAPVTLTNDLLIGASRYEGLIVFMDAGTGTILRTLPTGGSMSAGCATAGNSIYCPTGPGDLSLSPFRPLTMRNNLIKIGL